MGSDPQLCQSMLNKLDTLVGEDGVVFGGSYGAVARRLAPPGTRGPVAKRALNSLAHSPRRGQPLVAFRRVVNGYPSPVVVATDPRQAIEFLDGWDPSFA